MRIAWHARRIEVCFLMTAGTTHGDQSLPIRAAFHRRLMQPAPLTLAWMITRRMANWFNDRLKATSFAHHALNKAFPDDWSFMFGEIALYAFVILVLTVINLRYVRSATDYEVAR